MVYYFTMRNRYTYKQRYIWNPDLAYIAGLFASDGCLANNGRHLIMTSKDKEIINHTMRILEIKAQPRVKVGAFGTVAYHLQFSNVALYDFFLASGITPAKSKTMGTMKIPDEYYADFLRGYFDGDGTSYGYMDKRWKSSFMFYVGFTSASRNFLTYLQATNTALIGTTSGSIRAGTRVDNLVYAKADSLKLAAFMYYGSGVPHLARKKAKLDGFITKHQNAILAPTARVL